MKCIVPNYIKNFLCDGTLCESRCCHDWQVIVDNETHKKYLSLNDENILKHLTKSKDGNSIVFNMKENGCCPFLGKDFLCKIQKRLGENFLSDICQSYPRVTYKLETMTLTCPVAAKLILLSDKIIFSETDEIKERAVFDRTKKIPVPANEVLKIQSDSIKILQDRNFSINERLMHLCVKFGSENIFSDEFDEIKNVEILLKIFVETYEANFDNEKFTRLKHFILFNRKKLLNFLHENFSNILENYLVNEFIMRCYPYAFVGDELANVKIFLTSFRVMEFALVFVMLQKAQTNSKDLLKMICSINDRLDHSRGGMDAVINFVNNTDEKNFFKTMLN